MINCDGLVKIYETDDKKVMALEGLDLTVETGEMLAVIGKSGSGKSTLLNMIGGLETPTAGVLTIDGKDISTYSEAEMVRYRRDKVGFVWQKSAKNLFASHKLKADNAICFGNVRNGFTGSHTRPTFQAGSRIIGERCFVGTARKRVPF